MKSLILNHDKEASLFYTSHGLSQKRREACLFLGSNTEVLPVELEEGLSDFILQQNNPRATSKSTRISLWSCDGTNRGDQRRLLTYTITKINIKKSRFTTIIIANAFDLNGNHSKLQVGSVSRAPLPQVSAPSPQGPEPSEASPGPWLL